LEGIARHEMRGTSLSLGDAPRHVRRLLGQPIEELRAALSPMCRCQTHPTHRRMIHVSRHPWAAEALPSMATFGGDTWPRNRVPRGVGTGRPRRSSNRPRHYALHRAVLGPGGSGRMAGEESDYASPLW